MKNEDSRGLRRLHKARNYVPKFKDILHRSKHLKRQKKHVFSASDNIHKRLAHRLGHQVPKDGLSKRLMHEMGRQEPNTSLTCKRRMAIGLGVWLLAKKVTIL
ncbi:hypothetical protein MtrunA17_Chr8g0361871 [Medicago truncatula]|uniref:Uncharacterized protein n=1 Tax=Medicago truncatula TaxID=3880 RepID=G7LAY0_MEDTR|nr:hypothetical protein MTR_8g055970 [Medicago truncatula]RHN41052.1 hypothetical protein MtrunA17_Chr8g0361871 [Medicago truncatula]